MSCISRTLFYWCTNRIAAHRHSRHCRHRRHRRSGQPWHARLCDTALRKFIYIYMLRILCKTVWLTPFRIRDCNDRLQRTNHCRNIRIIFIFHWMPNIKWGYGRFRHWSISVHIFFADSNIQVIDSQMRNINNNSKNSIKSNVTSLTIYDFFPLLFVLYTHFALVLSQSLLILMINIFCSSNIYCCEIKNDIYFLRYKLLY